MASERILHAAVTSENGHVIFMGKSHADCFAQAANLNIPTSTKASGQGFVTSMGNYVTRFFAAEVAFKAGQIPKPLDILFSEDLWRDNGFEYDYVKGYYKDVQPIS